VGLNELVQFSLQDTRASLWPWFAPELTVCGTILVILMMRVTRLSTWIDSALLAFLGSAAALYFAVTYSVVTPGESFTGMLVVDSFSSYIRALLMGFLVLFTIMTRITGIPTRRDAADFYCLILGSVLGMCLMASANHLLIVFLGVEMASVPSYVLAATVKGNRRASEAALKYSIYGAGAAGVMLYGISLLAGLTGSAHLPTIATNLQQIFPAMIGAEKMVLVLGGLMIAAGLAFKLSAFPFHFWCPDVFEGASAEVDAFLSIASKAAALALLVRVCFGIAMPSSRAVAPPAYPDQAQVAMTAPGGGVYSLDEPIGSPDPSTVSSSPPSSASDELAPVRRFIALVVACIAAVTCTFGNLAAYAQTNIKRLLAYSTIAHAGYMLLPVAAALAVVSVDKEAAARAIGSIGFYAAIYLFMNLGAFAMVAFLRNALQSENIADYAGLIQRSPMLVICTAVIFFSLVGIPPLAGFAGKFAIFSALAETYSITRQPFLLGLLVIGGINTAISLFYYLRVVKVMAIDPEPDRPQPFQWSMVSLGGAFLVAVTVPLILLFLAWNQLLDAAQAGAAQLF
jgi:NADH-quinone oxidoreductase subunit N